MSDTANGHAAGLGAPASRDDAQVQAHWQCPNVTADAVAAQLVRLRRASVTSDDQSPVQASVVNLVAYAPGPELRERASAAMAQLSGAQPSRAILLSPEPGDSFHLSAAVTLFARSAGDRQLRFEQVLLRPHGGSPRHLSTLVIPLLIPHLTTVVWWMPETFDPRDPALRSLSEFCDRIVTNSRDRHPESLPQLDQLMRRVGIGDFAWSRLDAWREMTAQLFDGSASMPYLEGLEEVTITGSREPESQPSVPEFLFIGWLASRLGLRPQRLEGDRLRLVGMGRRTWVRLVGGGRADDPAENDGRLVGIELRCRHLHESATYRVERTGDNLTARAEIHGHETARTSRRQNLDDVGLLLLQLERTGRDAVFEDAVRSAAEVAEMLGHTTPQ